MGAIFHGTGIESRYVDGVSITYNSSPCKHIWTYVGGYNESDTNYDDYNCPCINGKTIVSQLQVLLIPVIYCGMVNNVMVPCCTAPNMPWFTTTLNDTTTSDTEVRACTHHGNGYTPVDIIQLYIK